MTYILFIIEIVKATMSTLETGQDKGVFVDFKRRDSHYECIRVDTVKEIIEKVSTDQGPCTTVTYVEVITFPDFQLPTSNSTNLVDSKEIIVFNN